MNYTGYYAQNIEPIIASPQGKLVAVHHHHRGPALYGFHAHFDVMQARLENLQETLVPKIFAYILILFILGSRDFSFL